MIVLTSDLKTGVAEIDQQHEELFKRINAVHQIYSSFELKEEIENTLKFLGSYIKQHFESEEELQRKYKYPQHEWHKTMHGWYIAEFNKLNDEYKANGVSVEFSELLNHSVTNWIVKHISQVDKNLGNFINQQRKSF